MLGFDVLRLRSFLLRQASGTRSQAHFIPFLLWIALSRLSVLFVEAAQST